MAEHRASPPLRTTPPERAVANAADTDRPTLVPAFDLEAFARESDSRQRAALPADAEGEAALERECLSVLGSESTVLVVAVPAEELKRFALDHVSGFLLSLLDGTLPVGAVLDVCGLPRLRALVHLRSLMERGILGVASGYRRPPVPRTFEAWAERPPRVVDDGPAVESQWTMHAPGLESVPVLLQPRATLEAALEGRALALSLLARVDDRATVREILILAGMDAAEGAALFDQLAEEGAIALV